MEKNQTCKWCGQEQHEPEWSCDGTFLDCMEDNRAIATMDKQYKSILVEPLRHCHGKDEYDAVMEWCGFCKLDATTDLFQQLYAACKPRNEGDVERRCNLLFHEGDPAAHSFRCDLYEDGQVVITMKMGLSGMGRDMMCLPDTFDEFEESGSVRDNDYIEEEWSEEEDDVLLPKK